MENSEPAPTDKKEAPFFCDRRRELARICGSLAHDRPQCIAITGLPGTGKSHLLAHIAKQPLLQARPDAAVITWYRDLADGKTTDPQSFWDLFFKENAEAISRHVADPSGGGYDAFHELAEQTRDGRLRIVMLLDHFDAVTQTPSFPLDFYSFLRAMANSHLVAYVTTSRSNLQSLFSETRFRESPFANIFTTIKLRPFSEEQSREFVLTFSEERHAALEPYFDFIHEMSGGFPGLLHACCMEMEKLCEQHATLDELALSEFRTKCEADFRPYFEDLWRLLEPAEKEVLRLLLSGSHVPEQLQFALNQLTDECLVVTRGYEFVVFPSAFRRFVIARCDLRPGRPASKTWMGLLKKHFGRWWELR